MIQRDKFIVLGVAAFAAGAGVGFLAGKQFLTARYAELAESEIQAAKVYYKDKYKQTYKAGEYETPEGAAKAFGIDLEEVPGVQLKNPPKTADEAAAMLERLRSYGPTPGNERPEREKIVIEGDDLSIASATEDTMPEAPHVEEIEGNIFVNGHVLDRDWDQNAEESKRTSTDSDGDPLPYIITRDEFRENEQGYEQTSITYFDGDDIAAGSDDKPIEDVEGILGDDNLLQFGHGSKDPNVVYIRNEKIEVDFEVTKANGSYGEMVAGFIQHSNPGLRRFRDGDDE